MSGEPALSEKPPVTKPDRRAPFVRIVRLILLKQYDSARKLAAETEPQHPNYQARLRFTEALILKAEGKYTQSAQEMRQILAENPNFSAVTQELAHTETLARDQGTARKNFTALRKDFSDRYYAFEAESSSAQRQQEPLRIQTYFGLAPGKREKTGSGVIYVNGAPFPVTAPPQEKSRFGVNAGASVGYRIALNEKTGITPGVAYHGKLYDKSALNEEIIRSELTFDRFFSSVKAFAILYSDRGLFGGTGFSHDLGVNVGATRLRETGGSDTVTAGMARNSFDSAKSANGETHEIRYETEIPTGADHGILFDFRASTKNAREKFNGYDGVTFGAGGYFIAPFHLYNVIRLESGYVKYKAVDPLFLQQRRARPFSFSLRSQKTDLKIVGFSPVFEYRYRDSRDAIGLYRLTSHEFGVKAIREF